MLNEADLRDGAAATDAVPAEGASDTPRTSRRLLLGGSLAALGLAAGGLPRLSVTSPAAAQGAPAAAPAAAKAAPAGADVVKAPMPGNIVSISVSEGASVKKGQVLLVLEAMKMENEIVSPRDGVVSSILVSKGASVNSGDGLIALG